MIKIMIIDDEPIFREHLCATVDWKRYGFEVCAEAENGCEALEKVESSHPDIVLVDINMPFMDGLAFTEKLSGKYPRIAVVIVTGHDEFEYAKKAVKLGVKDYILKPFDNEELMSTLIKVRDKILEERKIYDAVRKNPVFMKMDIIGDLDTDKRVTKSARIAKAAKRYISENYSSEGINVERIAERFYINSRYLRKVFKSETGCIR